MLINQYSYQSIFSFPTKPVLSFSAGHLALQHELVDSIMEKLRCKVQAERSFFNHIMKSWSYTGRKTPHGVVMVLPRPGGKVLLMTKAFYPADTYRLASGGMQQGETPEQAFTREVREETGLDIPIIEKLAEIDCKVVHEGKSAHYHMHVFLGEETSAPVKPIDESEEITEFREVPVDDLPQVAEQLRSLIEPWRGWGEFWAVPHDVAYRALKTEEKQKK